MGGRYRLLREIGRGGMGVVHEADDLSSHRRVAVKMLSPKMSGDLVALLRFKREARTASSLSHPNICRIHDIGDSRGAPFIVMELLEGETLKEAMTRRGVEGARVLHVATEAAQGLRAAHARFIVHRDVKPANVFLTASGQVKILDFGLAKHFARLDPAMSSITVTEPDQTPGTVDYMSPEQLLGRRLDPRTDLFSLGVVLYELLAGRRPFHASSRMETMAAILQRPPAALPAIPFVGAWSRVLMQLLAKDPERRYPDAAALLRDLARLKRLMEGRRVRWAPVQSSHHVATEPSVVVMPFGVSVDANAATEARQEVEYFCHSLVDEVQGALARVDGLRVVPRTLVARRSSRHKTPSAVGRHFHVESVLAGTMAAAGDRLDVEITLHGVRARTPLVTRRSSVRPDELYRLRDEVVHDVIGALGLPAGATDPVRPVRTADRRAFHLCLKGRFFWGKRYEGGLLTARQCFEEAIRLDPGLALAHAGLADTYSFLGFYCLVRPRDAFRVARTSVEAALDLDDRSSDAQTSLGLIKLGGDWDWGAALEAFTRAVALNPASGLARIYRSWLLSLLGRIDEAEVEAERAQDIDPLSPTLNAGAAYTLFLSRSYERSIRECEKALEVTPDFLVALYVMALCKAQLGHTQEAAEHLERAVALSGGMPFYLGLLGKVYADLGHTDKVDAILARLDELSRRTFVPAHCYVYIYAGLGDFDQAFRWQDEAFEQGASPFNYFAPVIECLHDDPRFKDDLRAWGLEV